MGYVQGVNKGIYVSNVSTRLSAFNTYAQNNSYSAWRYQNGTFSLIADLELQLDDSNKPNYTVNILNYDTNKTYTYKWYINDTLDNTITGNTITKQQDENIDFNIFVLVSDGSNIAALSFVVPKYKIEISFNVNNSNATVTATLVCTAFNVNQDDYDFQWYTVDAAGVSEEIIDGATSRTLQNLESGVEYKLVATHKTSNRVVEDSFIYGTRTVIYVDYNNGSNNRNGLTPSTAVQTMASAYGKLSASGGVNQNIIVLMGNYNNTSFMSTKNDTTYQRNTTITGIYDGTDYSGSLYFAASSTYRYMAGETNFQHITLRGSTGGYSGNGSLYFYLQGYSLTMGEGVTMTSYAAANSNQGLITGSAPAVHIIAGWHQYNYATLPRNNSKIIIKSGAYGRIILGGSPGTTGTTPLQQTTSRNFTGSSFNDMFHVEVDIDIKNSTKGTYQYDINLLVGGPACGNTYANVTENIYNGSIGRVLGASLGDSSDRPNNWRYPLNTQIGTSTVNVYGGVIQELYGGCLGRNMDALNNNSRIMCDSYFYGDIYINIYSGTILGNIYGAGAGGVTGYSVNSSDAYKSYGEGIDTAVHINISGGTVNGNIFGGGYGYTEYLTAAVTQVDAGALYGNSYINIAGSPSITGNIYGAGCGYNLSSKPNTAQMTGNSEIVISGTPTITGNIFGAGAGIQNYQNMAKLTGNSTITIGANLTHSVYGGGNIAETVGETTININSGNHTADIFGGGNVGKLTGESHVNINGGTSGNVFGGGNLAEAAETNVNINGGTTTSVYGGGNQADAGTTNVTANGGTVTSIFGGSNQSGTVTESNIEVISGIITTVYGGNNQGGTTVDSNVLLTSGSVPNIYGGNNEGGTTTNTHVEIAGGTATNVYGGGNRAVSTNTNVLMTNGTVTDMFGGGNAANVSGNTNVNITGGTINNNVYGGGNDGTVTGNTNLSIKNAAIHGSCYAGGNGATAIVYGNANITVGGTAVIGSSTDDIIAARGSVFGGGNAAATGDEMDNDSTSTVNIVGGTIYGNVYGGANTSVVYGYTDVNIGYDAVNDSTLTKGDIYIRGTIFGGGEANAEGSEVYDFSFISVTEGIEINIDGNGHNRFETTGSIFGSGNASSTTGDSYITVKNYGARNNPGKNISVQRATTVTLDNTCMALSGTTDRTNEYSTVKFTFSRIDELKLKNNSVIFLDCGTNLLKEFSSVVDVNNVETLAAVTIDEEHGTVTKNVDNRVYIYEGKNVNIALNENVTLCGDVNGMTFLGLYNNSNTPAASTGLYDYSFNNGDEITNAGTFVSNSYVKGSHKTNHDIEVDGFYTNYDEENVVRVGYVGVTPDDDTYYIWSVGREMNVTTFPITLTASKYATLGTYELSLDGFSTPNTKFLLIGFASELNNGIVLVDHNQIPAISPDEDDANTIFGLSMRSGKMGWNSVNRTDFYTNNGNTYVGQNYYLSENSSITPTLVFCLHHSQNLNLIQELGSVTIRFQVLTPIDDLNDEISYIDIVIDMTTLLNQDSYYEAAITPGEEIGLFTTIETNITDDGEFSTYYSLLINDFSDSDFYQDYTTYKRVLVSRDSNDSPYSFKAGTKITMLDMATNKYYYYNVSSQDQTQGKYIYKLSDFIEMGSKDKKYNEIRSMW